MFFFITPKTSYCKILKTNASQYSTFCNVHISMIQYAYNWTSDSHGRMGGGWRKSTVRVEQGGNRLTDNDNGGSDRFLHHGTWVTKLYLSHSTPAAARTQEHTHACTHTPMTKRRKPCKEWSKKRAMQGGRWWGPAQNKYNMLIGNKISTAD